MTHLRALCAPSTHRERVLYVATVLLSIAFSAEILPALHPLNQHPPDPMENLHTNKPTEQTSITTSAEPSATVGFAASSTEIGTTTFTADGPSLKRDSRFRPPFTRLQPPDDPIAILGRPTRVNGGDFVNGSIATKIIDLPSPITLLPSGYNNLIGTAGLRATICYRLEIVAAPQTSGIVKLVIEPIPALGFSKTRHRATCATMYNVEVNLANASVAEIRCPFIWDRDYWDLKSTYVDDYFLYAAVCPYLPVQWDTTTVSTPSYSLYRWLEDIEQVGKTTALVEVIPQSANGQVKSERYVGPISSWMGFGSRVASALSVIPSLSKLTSPLSWALDTGAKVAAHFGYSKPYNGTPSSVIYMSQGRSLNTCADQEMLQPMGMFANNQVATLTGMNCTDDDEMAINYLTSIPGAIATFELTPTDTINSIKYVTAVNPAFFCMQMISDGVSGFAQKHMACIIRSRTMVIGDRAPCIIPTPMGLMASHFQYWRGGIVFRVKFASTKFHSGRVLLSFIPSVDPVASVSGVVSVAPDFSKRYDFENILVDLRTTSEVDLCVPYIYPTMWCRTDMDISRYPSNQVSPPYQKLNPHSTGVFTISIVDPIYGPDNVPQNIPVIVEVMACEDFEFSAPMTSLLIPTPPYNEVVVTAQSADVDDSFEAVKYCSGERILSIKQLMLRPLWTYMPTLTVDGQLATKAINFIDPSTRQDVGFVTPNPAFNPPSYPIPMSNAPVWQLFSPLYALFRGSTVVKVVPPGTDKAQRDKFVSTLALAPTGAGDFKHAPWSVEFNTMNAIHIPFYGQHNRLRVGWNGISNPKVAGQPRTLWYNLSGKDTAACLGISVGDDFQFSVFTGITPCYVRDNVGGLAESNLSDTYFSAGLAPIN